jgi:hypothetical protein
VIEKMAEAQGEPTIALHMLNTQPQSDRWALKNSEINSSNAFRMSPAGTAPAQRELLARR